MPSNLFGVPQPGGVAAPTEYAVIGLVIQADLNNAPIQWRDVRFSIPSLDTNIAGVGATATEITGVPAGRYIVNGSLFLLSNSARTNLNLSPSIGGVELATPRGASGYIRAASGHNNSTVHVNGEIELVALSTVGMRAIREASGGAVTSIGGNGQLSIVRIV